MSAIEWTGETWNVVTGCTKVSPGCKNCYMYRGYPRLQAMGNPSYQQSPGSIVLHPKRLLEPKRWRKPRLVFVNSMSDTFHERVPDHFLRWLLQAMLEAASRGHTFQLLTKRPQRALEWWKTYGEEDLGGRWPERIWLGVSVESQEQAGRIGYMRHIPAPVRFVSAEPLLGPLNLKRWGLGNVVTWVIVGGESGPKARPMLQEWALDLLQQCDEAGIPAFLKQLGGRQNKRGGDQAVIEGRTWRGMPTC